MTGHIVLIVTARKFDVDWNHTLTAVFSTCRLLTCMIARTESALAWLLALEDVVHSLRMAPSLALMTAVGETFGAGLTTSAFRAKVCKVFGLADFKHLLGMSWTAKAKRITDGLSGSKHVNDFLPHGDDGIRFGVSDNVHAMLSSTKQHIDAVSGLQETHVLLFVAADK
jgi:hypothetical protein